MVYQSRDVDLFNIAQSLLIATCLSSARQSCRTIFNSAPMSSEPNWTKRARGDMNHGSWNFGGRGGIISTGLPTVLQTLFHRLASPVKTQN